MRGIVSRIVEQLHVIIRSITMSKADPSTVQSANWAGSVPVHLSLAPTSLSSATTPPALHRLVPRSAYLHVALREEILRLHQYAPVVLGGDRSGGMIVRAAPPDDDLDGSRQAAATASRSRARSGSNASAEQLQTSRRRSESVGGGAAAEEGGSSKEAEQGKDGSSVPVCWFEDENSGLALRWHLFAGTLFDLSSKRNSNKYKGIGSDNGSDNSNTNTALPWKLRVHFTSYPTNQILPFNSSGTSSSSSGGGGGDVMPTIRKYYMNSLKQALFLQHGSTQVAMNISKADHRKLWDAVASSNFHLYGEINVELQADVRQNAGNDGSSSADGTGDDGLRNIPVRVLVDSKPAVQRLCPPFREEDEVANSDGDSAKSRVAVTLGDALLLFCPNLFEKECRQVSKEETEKSDSDADKGDKQQNCPANGIIPTESLVWVVQGIAGIPLTFPIGQIWRTLCSPDHFLYVSVITR